MLTPSKLQHVKVIESYGAVAIRWRVIVVMEWKHVQEHDSSSIFEEHQLCVRHYSRGFTVQYQADMGVVHWKLVSW